MKILLTIFLILFCSLAWADTVTYYFDGYNVGEAWVTSPGNLVDGDTGTRATSGFNEIQLNDSNTGPGTDLGTITTVEVRAFWDDAFGILGGKLRPVFSGGDGDDHTLSPQTTSWSDYIDITSDTNAPGTWSWTNVQDLDIDFEAVGTGVWGYKIEIRVTYTTGNVTVTPSALPITVAVLAPTIVVPVLPTKIQGATLQGATIN